MLTRGGTMSTTVGAIHGVTSTYAQFPVTAGQPFTAGMSVKTSVAGAIIYTRWLWYDTGMVLTAATPLVKVANTVAGQVYRVADTGIPIPGTTSAFFQVLITQATNTVGGELMWGDLLTLENGATDGSWF